MAVSGSGIAGDIKDATGFKYDKAPDSGAWVDELGGTMEDMWTGGATKEAPGQPTSNASPPPNYLPWTHTHGKGADGLSTGSGSVGSALAKALHDAIAGAIKDKVASSLATVAGVDGMLGSGHNHAITDVGSYDLSSVDGLSAEIADGVTVTINLDDAPELQKLLSAIESKVESGLKSGALDNADDTGDGSHVHDLL